MQSAVIEPQFSFLSDIMSHWFNHWSKYFPTFPDNYLVIDLELTGLNKESDLIVEYGFCEVKNRELVNSDLCVLNWPESSLVDQTWLKDRVKETKASIKAKSGKDLYKIAYDDWRANSQSVEPIKGLRSLHKLLTTAKDHGQVVLGHNIIACDMGFITGHFKEFLNIDFEFGPNDIWDTGVIEKASQLGDKYPWPGETFIEYGRRVHKTWSKGVIWNLHDHCVKKYNLQDSPGFDTNQDHTAQYDAMLGHYLFEKMREMCNDESNPNDRAGAV